MFMFKVCDCSTSKMDFRCILRCSWSGTIVSSRVWSQPFLQEARLFGCLLLFYVQQNFQNSSNLWIVSAVYPAILACSDILKLCYLSLMPMNRSHIEILSGGRVVELREIQHRKAYIGGKRNFFFHVEPPPF